MRFYDNLLGHDLIDPKLELNKRGHRCKDIEDINLHNYILFAGDNVALDFNSPLRETYPFLISEKLGVDYYNLAIFNGGIDAAKFNILSWLRHVPKKPKALIISFEFLNSLIVSDPSFTFFKVADYSDDRVKQILVAGETCGFLPGRHILYSKSLLKHINIPIYQIEFKDKTPLFFDDTAVTNIKHEGEIFDHNAITNTVLEKYQIQKVKILP